MVDVQNIYKALKPEWDRWTNPVRGVFNTLRHHHTEQPTAVAACDELQRLLSLHPEMSDAIREAYMDPANFPEQGIPADPPHEAPADPPAAMAPPPLAPSPQERDEEQPVDKQASQKQASGQESNDNGQTQSQSQPMMQQLMPEPKEPPGEPLPPVPEETHTHLSEKKKHLRHTTAGARRAARVRKGKQ
jgi:hypothetical protein